MLIKLQAKLLLQTRTQIEAMVSEKKIVHGFFLRVSRSIFRFSRRHQFPLPSHLTQRDAIVFPDDSFKGCHRTNFFSFSLNVRTFCTFFYYSLSLLPAYGRAVLCTVSSLQITNNNNRLTHFSFSLFIVFFYIHFEHKIHHSMQAFYFFFFIFWNAIGLPNQQTKTKIAFQTKSMEHGERERGRARRKKIISRSSKAKETGKHVQYVSYNHSLLAKKSLL